MGFNRVNPPKQVVLPLEVSANAQLKKAFDDVYLIMFQMWKRLGGGADWVNDNRTIGYEFDDLFSTDAKEQIKDDLISTSINYTTIGDQTIICTGAVTVFLNETPNDRELAKVKITNGDVTINSGSRLIDNQTDITVIFKNLQGLATLDCVYTIETDSWWIV